MKAASEWFESWNGPSYVWIWFVFAAALTFYTAWKMVKYASGIISKTKLGSLFVGGVLVSIATSIPELISEISQSLNNTPSLGLADDIGANAFSTFSIAVVLMFFLKYKFLGKIDSWTKFSIVISWLLSFTLMIILLFGKDIAIGKVDHYAIGLIPIGFFVIWIFTTIGYFFYSKRKVSGEKGEPEPEIKNISTFIAKASVSRIVWGFTFFCFLLVLSSLALNISVEGVQTFYKIPESSAGGIFLSMTTAMAEVIGFTFFAIEKRADAAVGSILGSHIFNLSAVFFGDLAYAPDAVLNAPLVANVWRIALIVFVELFLLLIYLAFHKKIRWKYFEMSIYISVILTYICGWVLILLFPI